MQSHCQNCTNKLNYETTTEYHKYDMICHHVITTIHRVRKKRTDSILAI